MHSRFHPTAARWFGLCALALLVSSVTAAEEPRPLEFQLRFDKAVRDQPFTGRVYVLLTKLETKELPGGFNWFKPEPIVVRDVKDWQPGETLVLDAAALGFPHKLGALAKDTYSIHAVLDLDRGERSFSTADGNIHSAPLRRELDGKTTGPVELVLDKVYPARAFPQTDQIKLVEVESKLLSEFHKRPVRLRAGVVLPKGFAGEAAKRYPVLYVIPGFSGTHFGASTAAAGNPTDVAGVEMLYVVLDPSCRFGHSVFADSENNGPCGQALITELIPAIEKQYRALAVPTARFLTGHSSGGWSSLWLQISYPDFFGGTWSTSPDAVDFRDFQRVNIYRPRANAFVEVDGKQRPLARRQGKVLLHFKPFSDMEEVMGHGGQLGSFEAVFGPKGADGKPKQLWDRSSGALDPAVARSWEKYDIRLVLERNWQTLGPKLAGKLHVFMGGEDTFYLEGATVLLKESLAKLGSDAVIEIFPGKDHNLLDDALRQRLRGELAAAYRRKHGE